MFHRGVSLNEADVIEEYNRRLNRVDMRAEIGSPETFEDEGKEGAGEFTTTRCYGMV